MRKVMLLICSLLICVQLGCGKSGLNGTIPTTGKITYKSQPIEGATVVFSPIGEGRSASGLTDAQGNFKLTTLMANDGALEGKYKVYVMKTTTDGKTNMTPDEARATLKSAKPTVLKREEGLPVKYKTDAGGLSAEVTSSGKNDFPFDLVD